MNPSAPTPEQQPSGSLPEIPAAPEAAAPVAPAPAVPAPVPQLPATPAPAPLADDVPVGAAPTTNPVLAEDVDVIEKEWVDKAEEVVKTTAGDPHAEEEAVEAMQVDYLKKRYDHSVDKPAE